MSNPDSTTAFAAATLHLVSLLGPEAEASSPREQDEAGIDVTLIGIAPCPPVRHVDRRRRPVQLDFLVSVSGPPLEAADHLHAAWVALNDAAELDVGAESVPVDWWRAFGVSPRPAFLVRTTVPLDETLDRAGLAERHVVIHHDDADTEGVKEWIAANR